MSLRNDGFRKSNFRKGKSLKATSSLIFCGTTTIGMMALSGSSNVNANWFSEYAWKCWNFLTKTAPGYLIELFSNLKGSGGKTSGEKGLPIENMMEDFRNRNNTDEGVNDSKNIEGENNKESNNIVDAFYNEGNIEEEKRKKRMCF